MRMRMNPHLRPARTQGLPIDKRQVPGQERAHSIARLRRQQVSVFPSGFS
jgi:hypothetical protein